MPDTATAARAATVACVPGAAKRALGLVLGLAAAVAAQAAMPPFDGPPAPEPTCEIDRLVCARLAKLGIERARLSSDAVFLRRAYLDVIGTLPTAEEARAFLADPSPTKRAALIDALLARPEYADYWAMRWSDVLRIKAEFPINLWPNAAQAYHRWVRTALAENLPYDAFARALLTSSGSNFRVPSVNFYRAMQDAEPETMARAAARVLMGTRADAWPEARRAGMAAFFARVGFKSTAEWKEEIVFFDRTTPVPEKALFPDGTLAFLEPGRDPRQVFADWLIDARNPYFARAIVNRTWAWLMGRGIVHEPDDLRPDNPATHPALAAYLEKELVRSGWDLKHLVRMICTSSTYQFSSIPGSDDPRAAAHFAHYGVRRLEAEVLIDAFCQVTGTHEEYSSMIPEPFTFIPDSMRSIALPDGSITSSFLEMFGRPPRDTGLASERNNRPTSEQRLHLLNSSHIQRKIERGPGLRALLRSRKKPGDVVRGLYLAVLSRYPTPEELKTVAEYVQAEDGPKGPEAAADLAWALFNSAEFLYRH